ncbi:MAG TPA: DcaP family trimeric outer membrane transporter, partial [Vicinamibacterales bacterium]|nr:DcaP family trimeric outer membrane transporter [Vicinamibacterales bacterium]
MATGSANAQTTTAVAVTPPVTAAEQPATEKPAAEKPATETTEQQQTVVVTGESKPDGFTVGGFTFKPGGRIKLDIIRDFDPIGSEDSFDPRTIPVDGSEGTNSNIHAKETRLFLDIRGPVEGKELKMFVETDFYGSGSTLRLRHAYGSYGGLLAGQTWSTFVDDNNFPNT